MKVFEAVIFSIFRIAYEGMIKKHSYLCAINTTNATSERHEASSDGSHPDAYGYMLWMESVKDPIMHLEPS